MKRHTRAHVREQRSRWIRKRIRRIRREWNMWPESGDALRNWDKPVGSLNKKDPWDCGRTRCGICRHWSYTTRDLRERAVADSELSELKFLN
jgi:hypothetical protein